MRRSLHKRQERT